MSVPSGFGGAALLRLRNLSEYLNRKHRELEALRAAGVGESRITALYPLDWVDWREAAERLSKRSGYFERNGDSLLGQLVLNDVADCISHEAMGESAGRIQALTGYRAPDLSYEALRLIRLELTVHLLYVLASPHFELSHPNRITMFRMRADDLLEDVRVFCSQLNESTNLVADSSF